jgi:hypothetical protein
MGSKDDRLQMSTTERMEAMATVKASAKRLEGQGSTATELGQRQSVALEAARSVIEQWPEAPRKTGEKILEHYGPPNEATPTKLFGYRTGPWSRMELTADEVLHHFPTPHTDYFTQYIDYRVGPDKASDVVAFDGSVIIDRTAGQIGARCDHEAFNTLTLNLAVEIIEGRRSVEDARRLYAETAAAYSMGRDAPYAERLLFTPRPDRPVTRTRRSSPRAWATRWPRRSRTPSAPATRPSDHRDTPLPPPRQAWRYQRETCPRRQRAPRLRHQHNSDAAAVLDISGPRRTPSTTSPCGATEES